MSSYKGIPDKEFNNIDIWETEEGTMKALFYIFIEYFHLNNNKISLPKSLDYNISLFENTIIHDNNFQKFVEDNYRVALEYHDEEDILHIVKF
jgi:hypothetical protein